MIKSLLTLTGILLLSLSTQAADTLSVEAAVTIGLENNYGIILSGYDRDVAVVNRKGGASLFMPTVNAGASANQTIYNTRQELFNGTINEGNRAQTNTQNANVTMSWTVFDGFRMFANMETLRLMESQGELQLRAQVESSVTQIMLQYFYLVQQKRFQHFLEQAYLISSERFRLAKARAEIGSGSELDMLQAQMSLNADSTALINSRFVWNALQSDFNQLLGRDPLTPFEVYTSFALPENLNREELLTRTHSNNVAVLIALTQREIAEQSVNVAQSYLYPTLSVNAGVNYTNLSAQIGVQKSNTAFGPALSATMNWNLFNGLYRQRQIQASRIRELQAEANISDRQLFIETAFSKAWINYQGSLQIVAIERENLKLAKRTMEIAFEKYKIGVLREVEFRDIQLSVINAEYRLLSAEFAAKQAETNLLQLSGSMSGLL